MFRKITRLTFRAILIAILFLMGILVFSTQIIKHSAQKYLYDNEEEIPHNRVGLVLGTAPFLSKGVPNPYFKNRMSAAARLFHAEKVKYIIASGDNRTRWYNEPHQMRLELIKLGVPDSAIYLDYAGLRTLDSVVRCKEIFGQDSYTVISQKFHNQRAIYLARRKGIEVIGFNAEDVPYRQNARTQFREWFARVKMFYDLLIRKQPHHLGEAVIIAGDHV